MKNKKKIITAIASLALVGAISIGATLAYLSAQTQTMTNTFTAPGTNLSIELREPAWDGYNFGEKNGNADPDGSSAKAGLTEEQIAALGITEAANFAPGSVAAKNPMVKNTSTQDVWIAVVVDKTNLPSYVDIAWNNTNWTIADTTGDKVIAYYNTTRTADQATEAVFTQVSIANTVSAVTASSFDIDVQAYAIQAANVDDLAAAQAAFAQQFPDVF